MHKKLILIFTISSVLSLLFIARVDAANFSVPTGNDSIAADATCRLSEALENIEDQATTNPDCPAGDGDDVILLPEGEIVLTANLPGVEITGANRSISIVGEGMSKTNINGGGTYTGFLFVASSSVLDAAVTIEGMKYVGMFDYACIIYDANSTVSKVEITESAASSGGTMLGLMSQQFLVSNTLEHSISDVYLHDNDLQSGTLIATQSLINTSNEEKNTIISVQRLTAHNNSFVDEGAVIQHYTGTDLGTARVEFSVENSTIADNTNTYAFAGAAIASGNGVGESVVTLTNNTIVDNVGVSYSGGIAMFSGASSGNTANTSVTLKNNIMAGNSSQSGPVNCSVFNQGDTGNESAEVTSLGGNLSNDATCGSAQSSDKFNIDISTIESTFGPIQNNGGLTPTKALLTGSPALDSGVADQGLVADQRGVTRPQGAAFDIGAYELEVVAPNPGAASVGVNGELAKTGAFAAIALPVGSMIIWAAMYVYFDYRRHKQPLIEVDSSVEYTLMHHIKVVTIPLLRYRVLVRFERQSNSGISHFR